MRATAATAIVHNSCRVSYWTPCDHDSTFESWLLGEHHSADSFFKFFFPCIKKITRAHYASSALHGRCMHA